MYLQKLRLNGFKSFADSTTVQFADGITAIVGPNGCGKSNVIDAVRWVLGEQRARILRSDKMDNVIFNGSGKKRRPLGLAEVELTIENTKHVLPTEFTEVTIARRLYRSGQSEYLLNGVACRLRDIQDLFMDTGMGAGAYSVIELRMIEDMLSDNAQDRRRLFEEAAGITKYKRRRDQALRKLKGTQDNLTRLNDLIEEITKTVNRLKRQAAKAARYKRFTADFQALALALAQSEFERLSNEQRALHERARTEGDQVEALTAQVDVAEAELETLRVALVDREKELAERQGVLNEHVDTLRQREADRRLNEERRQQAETGIERAGRMEQDAKQRRHDLAEERGRLEREVQSVEPLVQALTAAMAQAETAKTEATDRAEAQRREVERLRRHARERQDALRRAVQERDRVTNRIDLLRDEASRLQAEAATTQDAQAAARSRLAVAQANVANAETARRHAEEEAEEAKARRKRLEADLDRARQALRTSERQADALTAEIALLDELLASYGEAGESVQFLVQTPTWTAETPLTVSDIVRCAPEDQRAVDAVLGLYADCFVVADAAEAEQAARMLRDEEKGTARFLVLSRLPNVQMTSTPAG
ncbi:MAG: AAA family ATPase, partial [Bacteroidota bacterium]